MCDTESDKGNASHTQFQIDVVWPGVFRQEFHHTQKLLNTIRQHTTNIDQGYEEMVGQPPETRSRERIPNAFGTYKFHVAYGVDHEGGSTVMEPPDNWFNLPDVEVNRFIVVIDFKIAAF